MNCDQVKLSLAEYGSGELRGNEASVVAEHLDSCGACRAESAELAQVWELMGRLPVPEPSPMVRVRFNDMLAAYKEGQRSSVWHRFEHWLRGVLPQRPVWQAGLATACLVAGFGGGLAVNGSRTPELAILRSEVTSMRQLVTLSLLQQQSPSDRLKGVSWSLQMDRPTPEVPAALLAAAEGDENVNVRLAAVDALHSFVREEKIRQALVRSLPKQDSPLVQIAIIDVLAQARQPDVSQGLAQFARLPGVDASVKQRALNAVEHTKFQ